MEVALDLILLIGACYTVYLLAAKYRLA